MPKRIPRRKKAATVKRMYAKYAYDARKRGLSFELTIEQFTEIIESPCEYCGDEPAPRPIKSFILVDGPLYANGVDRMDNLKGYSPENSVSCCNTCNRIKSDYNLDDLIKHLKKIILKR